MGVDARPDNPLPACPGTPNCVRETRSFDQPMDALWTNAQAALNSMGPSEVTLRSEAHRLHAVFTVAFLFKDDLHLAVEPHGGGAVLHIRSASRVGDGDLGVNRRRVKRFFRRLDGK